MSTGSVTAGRKSRESREKSPIFAFDARSGAMFSASQVLAVALAQMSAHFPLDTTETKRLTNPDHLLARPQTSTQQSICMPTMKFSSSTSSKSTAILALALAALVALICLAPATVSAQRACALDINCKSGREFCLNGRCNLIACSWLDDDLSCRKFNATQTTYCNAAQNGQCVPRTALAGSSCDPNSARFDNPCAEGLVCDPGNSKCVDAGEFLGNFWEKNKTYIIIGIVVVVALAVCACCCFCFVVKKGVGFAGKLIGGATAGKKAAAATATETHAMQPQSNGYAPAPVQSNNNSYPPQQQGSYPPQQQGSYPPQQQGSYPPQSSPSYPPQQQQGGAYPPQPQGGSYPPQYPPQQGQYPPQGQQQQQQGQGGMYPSV
ncbi:hypothetical protein BCR44DRAFT_1215129 [Catenaria anguillulae PL171]|uniref:Uncharacterized protein n=1 Tax=Catenaria anguillulae PL171 TaxID=765915 RepID=A0A1Y2HYR8_9FUNG|nr:hypothetical protein BCR44DRAFT_1215129 [Catenaria anguillulae PL171]